MTNGFTIHINPRDLVEKPYITDVYVSSYHLEVDINYFEVTVVWTDTIPDPAPITYTVQYRAISSEEWITAIEGVSNFFVKVPLNDVSKYLYGNTQELEFRVIRTNTNSGDVFSDPYTFSFPPSLLNYHSPQNNTQLKYEMSKAWQNVLDLNSQIYYDNYGETFVLLSRKYVGNRCSCWNEVTHRTENPYCRVCYGTGVIGGYHPYPLKGLFQYQRTYKLEPQQQGYEYTMRTLKLITIPYPPIKSNDYIVRQDGTFYRVGSFTRARPSGVVIHQEVELIHADPNDPITRYPYYQYLNNEI